MKSIEYRYFQWKYTKISPKTHFVTRRERIDRHLFSIFENKNFYRAKVCVQTSWEKCNKGSWRQIINFNFIFTFFVNKNFKKVYSPISGSEIYNSCSSVETVWSDRRTDIGQPDPVLEHFGADTVAIREILGFQI